MKIETREKTTEYRVFIAEDGKEFDSGEKCKQYEQSLANLQVIWVVVESTGKALQHSYVNLHSTEEMAKAWVEETTQRLIKNQSRQPDRWEIRKLFLDEYQYQVEKGLR